MNRLIIFLFLIFIVVSCESQSDKVSNAAVEETSTQPASSSTVRTYSNITVSEAARNKDAVFLDVRTPKEVAQGKIPGALQIDVKNSNFKEEVSKLDKSKTYIVYCRSGNRSVRASAIMIDLGFENIINMEGGYNAWKDEMQ